MPHRPLIKTITIQDENVRIDKYIRQLYSHVPYALIQKMLRKGEIKVNSKKVNAKHRLESGQEVRIPPAIINCTDTSQKKVGVHLSEIHIEKLKQSIIYKNNDFIILNKESGLSVQGGSKTYKHLDGMLHYLKFDMENAPKLVHRLDKDTSGLLILARTTHAARQLRELFFHKKIQKTYLALTQGCPLPKNGNIKNKLLKIKKQDKEYVACDENGKWAETDYKTIDNASNKAALLALSPMTGRTHQIRVHCAGLNCPIIGDKKYNQDHYDDTKLMLHAYRLQFTFHGKPYTFIAPPPQYFTDEINKFGLNYENKITF